MKSFKPYRTKAQKLLAQKHCYKDSDGAYRSPAPFSLHGVTGEFIWNENGHPVYADTKKRLLNWAN